MRNITVFWLATNPAGIRALAFEVAQKRDANAIEIVRVINLMFTFEPRLNLTKLVPSLQMGVKLMVRALSDEVTVFTAPRTHVHM